MKLLVIEDDRTVGQYVKRGLTETGSQVDLVADGAEGLRLASDGHYDVVVLDLRLPSMDGRDVLRTLRDRGNAVPVLVLTAPALFMTIDDSSIMPEMAASGMLQRCISPCCSRTASCSASAMTYCTSRMKEPPCFSAASSRRARNDP